MNTNVRNDALDVGTPTCSIPCFQEELVARVRAALPAESDLDRLQVVFSALADRTRIKLLAALRTGEELCVCDLAHVAETTISTASHHLRKLKDVGVLRHRSDGKMAYYSLRDGAVVALLDCATGDRRAAA